MNDVIIQKYSQAKLEGLNTMITMVSALNQYFGKKFNSFLTTKNEEIINNMDTKLIAQYQKAQENIDKLMGAGATDNKKGSNPLVNINVNSATIKKTDNNTIELSDEDYSEKEKSVAEILSKLAEIKKINES